MSPVVFTNARIVTPEAELSEASLVVAGSSIAAIDPDRSHAAGAIDLDGDLLLPGLVELHTDTLEGHFGPRPGVEWPAAQAVLSHDAQIAAAGITTVYNAVFVGDAIAAGHRRQRLPEMLEALARGREAGHLRAEHRLHLRCELCHPSTADLFRGLIDTPGVGIVSVMDHTPGQRQFVDAQQYKRYYTEKHGMSDADFEAFAASQIDAHHRYSASHRTEIVALAKERGFILASHDDTTLAHVEEAIADGMAIAEFPTTPEAAKRAHAAGLAVLVGAPNLVLGGSHSGNVRALDLAAAGHADIVSSDYVPMSLLHAAFMLAAAGVGVDLAAAVRMVSSTPAQAAGLDDRGALVPGLRADFLRVRLADGLPILREVWCGGVRMM